MLIKIKVGHNLPSEVTRSLSQESVQTIIGPRLLEKLSSRLNMVGIPTINPSMKESKIPDQVFP